MKQGVSWRCQAALSLYWALHCPEQEYLAKAHMRQSLRVDFDFEITEPMMLKPCGGNKASESGDRETWDSAL